MYIILYWSLIRYVFFHTFIFTLLNDTYNQWNVLTNTNSNIIFYPLISDFKFFFESFLVLVLPWTTTCCKSYKLYPFVRQVTTSYNTLQQQHTQCNTSQCSAKRNIS